VEQQHEGGSTVFALQARPSENQGQFGGSPVSAPQARPLAWTQISSASVFAPTATPSVGQQHDCGFTGSADQPPPSATQQPVDGSQNQIGASAWINPHISSSSVFAHRATPLLDEQHDSGSTSFAPPASPSAKQAHDGGGSAVIARAQEAGPSAMVGCEPTDGNGATAKANCEQANRENAAARKHDVVVSAITFDDVVGAGDQSVQTVRVDNGGDKACTLTLVRFKRKSHVAFELADQPPLVMPVDLAPGQGLEISVAFRPLDDGPAGAHSRATGSHPRRCNLGSLSRLSW